MAGASAAIDILKVSLPLLAINLWRRSCQGWATVSAALWIACLSWSACSAIGFAVQTRGQANVERMTEQAAMRVSVAAISRAEGQLKAVGTARPVAVAKADLAATNVSAPIWVRTQECTDITVPESYAACSTVVSLRRELAVAEVAERLEETVAAGRQNLQAIKAAPTELDPQAATLSRLLGLEESFVRWV